MPVKIQIKPSHLRRFFIGISILLLTLCISNSNAHAQRYTSFADSATILVYKNKEKVGENIITLRADGYYRRVFSINVNKQTLQFEMTSKSLVKYPVRIRSRNPIYGESFVEIKNDSAFYSFGDDIKVDYVPIDYLYYDDFGSLLESFVFRQYDRTRGGVQYFNRYRISTSPEIQQTRIQVSVEQLGQDRFELKDTVLQLEKFKWTVFGISSTYWIDDEGRIYKSSSSYDNSVAVRKGYEYLLDFAPEKKSYSRQTTEIPMRDGVRLSTHLYTPSTPKTALPVILIRTPYNKDILENEGIYWSEAGYICAIQDVRGRFQSEGEWEPYVNEGPDGYDAIEWLASQSWCNGKIGMRGASYAGICQLQTAVEEPPHLTTIIPSVSPPDLFYNIPFENGPFFTLGALWWTQVIENESTANGNPQEILEITNLDYKTLVDVLPLIDLDKKVFGRQISYWRNWMTKSFDDPYWNRANYLDRLSELKIPVFLQSGWFDTHAIGTRLAYEQLTKAKNQKIKLIMGPWGHTDKASAVVSGHYLGDNAYIDLPAEYKNWFDYWLKGKENGTDTADLCNIYIINEDRWISSDTFPLPGTQYNKLFLSSKRNAVSLQGDGRLMDKPGRGAKFTEYIYDPADPTPSPPQRYKEGGRSNYLEVTSSRKDILIFETEPLKEDLLIAGSLKAILYASTNAIDTDWFLSLLAVDKNGGTIPLGKGVIRTRYRNSLESPEFVKPDKVYEYTLDLWQTGFSLPAGHTLRLEVSSAFFPEFSRNLNTGGNNETESSYQKAKQRVYHSRKYPSHIVIPIIEHNP